MTKNHRKSKPYGATHRLSTHRHIAAAEGTKQRIRDIIVQVMPKYPKAAEGVVRRKNEDGGWDVYATKLDTPHWFFVHKRLHRNLHRTRSIPMKEQRRVSKLT